MNTSTFFKANPHNKWVVATLFMSFFLISFIIIVLHSRTATPTLEKQDEALQVDVSDLQTKIAFLEQNNEQLSQRQEQIDNYLAILSYTQRSIPMAGTELCPDARGTFFIGDDSGILVAYGMNPLPKEQIYQLWLIPIEGVPFPLGRVEVAATQETVIISSYSVDADVRFAAIGISIENTETESTFLSGPVVLLGVLQ